MLHQALWVRRRELIAAAIKDAYYPGKSVSQLSEEEKQTISTLASISAGIAGGIAGGDTVSAANGAQAGKNSAENNFLSNGSPQKYVEKLMGCQGREM